MATAELENILKQLLVPDNQTIQKATLQLKAAFKNPDVVIPSLVELLQKSDDATIRQYCAILLRRRVVKQWKKINNDTKIRLRQLLLDSITKEPVTFVRMSICQVAGSIARHDIPSNTWPELLQFISQCVQSIVVAEREVGFLLLSSICESAAEELKPVYKDLFPAFGIGLNDGDSVTNPFIAIKCMIPLLMYFGTDEEMLLKPMLGQVLNIIQALVKVDEEKASEALDFFDELVQIEVGIIVPYVKDLVQFCMQIMGCSDLSDGLRVKALYLICWACRRKSKTLMKSKLLQPLVKLLLSLMANPEDEEDEDTPEGDEMNNLQSVAGQALDLLALHTPPNKIIPILMAELGPLFQSTNIFERKAAYIGLGELAEGCADYIRTKHLQNAIETTMKGLTDESVIVRNAALFALGQYSEHVQPEVGKFHSQVLPALLQFLQTVIGDENAAVNHRGTVTKLFYAIEKFTEGLEKEVIVPYTEGLMQAYITLLEMKKDSHTSELAISAIGALVASAQEHLTTFFPLIMQHLQNILSQPLTLETMDIHAQTVDTLGAIARYISPEAFLLKAAECMQFGLSMLESCEDPDLRRCTYGLFASISVVLKQNMEQYLPTIFPMMILSLKSNEGIVANYGDGNQDPSFLIEDDCDEEETPGGESKEMNDDDDDEDEDIAGYSVENAYMDEKEDTINSLAEIAENVGNGVSDYFEEIFKEIFLLVDYPHANVRKASTTAGIRLCIVLYKILKKNNPTADLSPVHSCLSRSLPTAINTINQDDDRYVVLACLEVLEELFKVLKGDAFPEKNHVVEFNNALMNVFKGKTHCQEFGEDDESSTSEGDEESQAELDQMLIEKTGDLLPQLAQAMGGAQFQNYFTAFLPEMMKRTRKNSNVAERSFAAGTIAEIIQGMGGAISTFVQPITPWLLGLLQDADPEVRSNASFALGVLAENGGEAVISLYTNILQALFGLLNQGQPALVQDNLCGAVARMIMTSPQALPLDQVLPVLVNCLPIQEDERENETVTKCFMKIYEANSTILTPFMEKLISWFVNSVNSPQSGLEQETRGQVKLVVADIHQKFPNETNQIMTSLNLSTDGW
ncbi:importin-4-like [Clytia hemisphaerica]|uniref:Importin N-terminal domain-containing protein n=1 Tax=Clytia hemisphaerica TaxID=252671 RepID=A0A7M5WUK3_9CNID